jgi:hypothetical protein
VSTANHITNKQLPLDQNFALLKQKGFDHIHEYIGNEWTNLNSSDPGVTILDQLCFALTELGYCNDFSIADILTDKDNALKIDSQFYLPEQILTTAPVTINDYRKYLIDGIPGIINAVVQPFTNTGSVSVNGVYQVYLLIDRSIANINIQDICRAAFFYLNKSRNIGELFLMPQSLESVPFLIKGTIEVVSETSVNKLLAQLQDQIQHYIFHEVLQEGYDQLIDQGIETNKICNGPFLPDGWIQTVSLGEKKNKIRAIELTHLLQSSSGIASVTGLSFTNKSSAAYAECLPWQIIFIDLIASIANNDGLIINYKGRKLSNLTQSTNSAISKSAGFDGSILLENDINIHVPLPTGTFRDINTYYSIQNTFPEIFAVGADAIITNASDFKMAQSRQLKGYLTLFDQVLANQFSQLANLDKLFSFKNAGTGNPSDEAAFYETKTPFEEEYNDNPVSYKNTRTENHSDEATFYEAKTVFERRQTGYPVPYRTFFPTYFYQSLYSIPHIKPLLKDNDIFYYGNELESDEALEQKSWNQYQQDPYNPYIRGLMEFVEDDTINLTRRNDILDHLLARHGESPLVINSIIDGTHYTGNSVKDQVILKSLLLQNLGLLSYHRQKGYNFIAPNEILAQLPDVTKDFDQRLLNGNTTDFIFNSEAIDLAEKLTDKDFINFSAVELKLNLLFGLKNLYNNYIATNYDIPESSDTIKLALWMIQQCKGFIFIETGLFQLTDDYKIAAVSTTNNNQNAASVYSAVEIILPDFIPQFTTPEFKSRLDLFLQNALPVQISYTLHFVNAIQLAKIIPVFCSWYNALMYTYKDDSTDLQNNQIAANTVALTNLITEIYAEINADEKK